MQMQWVGFLHLSKDFILKAQKGTKNNAGFRISDNMHFGESVGGQKVNYFVQKKS